MNGCHLDDPFQITEVWADNLEEEFRRIRDVVEHYQYIAMDTEFPGVVAKPTGVVNDYYYQTVKCNVDMLKVIQLGITFADSHGNLAHGTSTWQFNFCFDLSKDMYAQDSIDFLICSGVDFQKQSKKGIALQDFGELIMSSGLVMNEDVKWISFHGCYDFGYLLKLLTCSALPNSEAQFFELLHDFIPALYDIKFLLKNIKNLNVPGGLSLQRIAEHLNVSRVGQQHQAGSDSLVTCRTFFKLMETYFDNQIDDSKFSGIIFGLGGASASAASSSSSSSKYNRSITLDSSWPGGGNTNSASNNGGVGNGEGLPAGNSLAVHSHNTLSSIGNLSAAPSYALPDSSPVSIGNGNMIGGGSGASNANIVAGVQHTLQHPLQHTLQHSHLITGSPPCGNGGMQLSHHSMHVSSTMLLMGCVTNSPPSIPPPYSIAPQHQIHLQHQQHLMSNGAHNNSGISAAAAAFTPLAGAGGGAHNNSGISASPVINGVDGSGGGVMFSNFYGKPSMLGGGPVLGVMSNNGMSNIGMGFSSSASSSLPMISGGNSTASAASSNVSTGSNVAGGISTHTAIGRAASNTFSTVGSSSGAVAGGFSGGATFATSNGSNALSVPSVGGASSSGGEGSVNSAANTMNSSNIYSSHNVNGASVAVTCVSSGGGNATITQTGGLNGQFAVNNLSGAFGGLNGAFGQSSGSSIVGGGAMPLVIGGRGAGAAVGVSAGKNREGSSGGGFFGGNAVASSIAASAAAASSAASSSPSAAVSEVGGVADSSIESDHSVFAGGSFGGVNPGDGGQLAAYSLMSNISASSGGMMGGGISGVGLSPSMVMTPPAAPTHTSINTGVGGHDVGGSHGGLHTGNRSLGPQHHGSFGFLSKSGLHNHLPGSSSLNPQNYPLHGSGGGVMHTLHHAHHHPHHRSSPHQAHGMSSVGHIGSNSIQHPFSQNQQIGPHHSSQHGTQFPVQQQPHTHQTSPPAHTASSSQHLQHHSANTQYHSMSPLPGSGLFHSSKQQPHISPQLAANNNLPFTPHTASLSASPAGVIAGGGGFPPPVMGPHSFSGVVPSLGDGGFSPAMVGAAGGSIQHGLGGGGGPAALNGGMSVTQGVKNAVASSGGSSSSAVVITNTLSAAAHDSSSSDSGAVASAATATTTAAGASSAMMLNSHGDSTPSNPHLLRTTGGGISASGSSNHSNMLVASSSNVELGGVFAHSVGNSSASSLSSSSTPNGGPGGFFFGAVGSTNASDSTASNSATGGSTAASITNGNAVVCATHAANASCTTSSAANQASSVMTSAHHPPSISLQDRGGSLGVGSNNSSAIASTHNILPLSNTVGAGASAASGGGFTMIALGSDAVGGSVMAKKNTGATTYTSPSAASSGGLLNSSSRSSSSSSSSIGGILGSTSQGLARDGNNSSSQGRFAGSRGGGSISQQGGQERQLLIHVGNIVSPVAQEGGSSDLLHSGGSSSGMSMNYRRRAGGFYGSSSFENFNRWSPRNSIERDALVNSDGAMPSKTASSFPPSA